MPLPKLVSDTHSSFQSRSLLVPITLSHQLHWCKCYIVDGFHVKFCQPQWIPYGFVYLVFNRERTAMTAELRQAKTDGEMARLIKAGDIALDCVAQTLVMRLDDIVALVKRHCFNDARKREPGSDLPEDHSWTVGVMHRLRVRRGVKYLFFLCSNGVWKCRLDL